MLTKINWNIGVHTSDDWLCPIEVMIEEDTVCLVMHDEVAKQEGYDRLPLCQEHEIDLITTKLYAYESGLNLEHHLKPPFCDVRYLNTKFMDFWNRYYRSEYGVADTLPQILAYAEDAIKDTGHTYVLEITRIVKEYQPAEGGWRWHKWGQYIGTQEPQCEYLFDEPDIEEVLVFHFHEVVPISELGEN
jgi:hypothetical protein